jgi:phosphatidylserine decarboxylase
MTVKAQIFKIFEHEDVNFLLTNRIPRRLATQFIGWFSRIEQPVVRDLSIAVWRLFADLDLSEAKKEQFNSLHDCFIRELKDGVRPIDQRGQILVSPCDAIVGACGEVAGTEVYQAKGFPYALQDLLCDEELVEAYRDGCYATLRLKSSMYHRFHAPHDGRIERVRYISGDTWNVNPIALKRIERLFCKNERAALTLKLAPSGQVVTLVAVAAILVASIRCIASPRPSTEIIAGGASSTATAPCAKARSWAGSSMARRSSYSRRIILLYASTSATAPRSASASRSCVCRDRARWRAAPGKRVAQVGARSR